MFTNGLTDLPIVAGVGRIVAPRHLVTAVGLASTAGTTRLLACAVTTATNPFTYQIRGRNPGEPWTTVEFTTSATTASALRDGLIAAWNANAVLRGVAVASAASTGTAINWTAIAPGASAFEVEVVANSGSALGAITVTTAGAANAEVAFGRYVQLGAATRASNVQRRVIETIPALSGPVIVYTPTHAASQTVFWALSLVAPQVSGGNVLETYGGTGIATGADLAALIANIVTSLEAQLGGLGATVDSDATTVTLSLPVGYSVASSQTGASGGAALTDEVTAGDALPASVAFVYDNKSQAPASIGATVTGYPGGESVPYLLSGGDVAVLDPGDSPAAGDLVWIESAAGSTNGRAYGTASPTRFPHPTHRWAIVDTVYPGLAIIGA